MNRQELKLKAYEIAEEYARKGLRMTLRQLYYQFVARGLISNGQQSYKRIGAALTEARLAGDFPLEWLEDRSRHMSLTMDWANLDVEGSVAAAMEEIRQMPEAYMHAGRWHKQPKRVSVFVEKEALAGVLERTCKLLGVGLFPCKGYPSLSSLAQWIQQTDTHMPQAAHMEDAVESVIVYLGDHDPDGLQIPDTITEQIAALQDVLGIWFPVRLERVALTMAQIQALKPPPFPAKVSSSRFRRYVERTGQTDAWELDALDPLQLTTLVETEVDRWLDRSILEESQAQVHRARLLFRDAFPFL